MCYSQAGKRGDFALNRIIPDYFRAYKNNKNLVLRYPNAIRPWHHVIEPLYGYILLLMHISKEKKLNTGAWNFGPKKNSQIKVKKIVSLINSNFEKKIKVIEKYTKKNPYKESDVLMLNSEKSKKTLKWKPKYDIIETIKLISDWYNIFFKKKKNILSITQKQIIEYINQY